ncbi:chemotaxis protein CheA [Aliivibrio fischeri]|uniref:Chemotaxis protein CheA n=1 Tax=Aliivibrio fischeri TaxID=668 RepID=A0A6N3ZAH7_ALIFS|nr:chemotaxis protein CheA [Aliivibrio fischeri]MUK47185.1 chemotaxis protein CheA [Aliivibrio fischeri]MUK82642.1 chemotaxis protein CheA [Aliivibrio fischeri]MUK83242.1 chemotaxis protein CheA [Aliivibrio fischeri]
MSFEMDEDILQDFLIEAGEILELLSEQLVELEQRPDDADLLNAIFRGFHTVKGGAGFLSLTELVDACHGAENVFDILRTGKRKVTSELMDTILQALDTVNVMFSSVQNGEALEPADQSLLDELHRLSKPASEDEIASAANETVVEDIVIEEPVIEVTPSVEEVSVSANNHDSVDDITEDEFERLLDELHGKGASPSSAASVTPTPAAPIVSSTSADDGDITDDEFERLLDELHGSGKSPSNATTTPAAKPVEDILSNSGDSDLMTDDEFEKLLDQLHGSGKGPTEEELDQAVQPVAAMNQTTSAPAPVVEAPTRTTAPAPTRTQAPKEDVKAVAKAPAKAPAKSQSESTVRVDTSTLDNIMNMVGELVLVRNRLVSLGLNSNDEEMSKAVSNLDVVTADLQGAVMKTRMQPIKKVFGRFPRVVRDLARTLKKDIVLEMRGEETDLDKNLVEALADPLIHLVRNSVDHGIEMPDDRLKAGKDRTGKVILSASQEGDHILLSIIDDGGGMDADKLRGIAVNRGLMDSDAASRLTNKECYNLIFAPGFSTKTEISDISGRGVGMDVVKTAINQLNGSIDIDSNMGEGTKIVIKVPLTLAILPTLMVGVANQPFALPLASVNEIFHLDLSKTNIVDGQLTTIVREKSIPLFFLQDWLVPGSRQTERTGLGHVVIIQLGAQRVGFVVDTLIGQEEVVIKPLDELLQGTPGMAGATITSDGHIALILDVPNLLKRYAVRMR